MVNNNSNSLFEQAKNAINGLLHAQGNASDDDKQSVQSAIEAAKQGASPEEQQQLQELEQQLKQKNQLH